MNDGLDNNSLNKILLKPRFKIERHEDKAKIIKKFSDEFAKGGSNFLGKIVDHHIIIDVNKDEEHFWSPQLHVEVEEDDKGGTLIKGLYGPKPQIWSLFMFIHFGVALAFMVFLVLTYTRWSLEQDYTFAFTMTTIMPILWFVLYFIGRIGRKKGAEQIQQIDAFINEIIDN